MRPKGYKHTEETKKRISLSNTGKLSSQWKGSKAKYPAIHNWLVKNYGKAKKCSMINCPGKSKLYEWALIKGKSHTHNIKYYMALCRSCHHIYDESNKRNS